MVDDLSPEVMKNQLIPALQVNEFYQYIKRKNIMDLAHFRKKAEEWIAMEDACAAKKDDLNAATQQPQARNLGKPLRPPRTDQKHAKKGRDPRY